MKAALASARVHAKAHTVSDRLGRTLFIFTPQAQGLDRLETQPGQPALLMSLLQC